MWHTGAGPANNLLGPQQTQRAKPQRRTTDDLSRWLAAVACWTGLCLLLLLPVWRCAGVCVCVCVSGWVSVCMHVVSRLQPIGLFLSCLYNVGLGACVCSDGSHSCRSQWPLHPLVPTACLPRPPLSWHVRLVPPCVRPRIILVGFHLGTRSDHLLLPLQVEASSLQFLPGNSHHLRHQKSCALTVTIECWAPRLLLCNLPSLSPGLGCHIRVGSTSFRVFFAGEHKSGG